MTAPFHYCIDVPGAGARVDTPYVLLSGWITTTPERPASRLRLRWGGRDLPLDQTERPDVRRVFPASWACGFQGLYALSDVPGDVSHPRVCFDVGGAEHGFDAPVEVEPSSAAALAAAKARKAARIRPLLRCPLCRSGLSGDPGTTLVCDACLTAFGSPARPFDFLPDSLRARHKVGSTSNISAWGYDARAGELIERFPDGLILDCGCGLRPEYVPNVVNFEIADYPTSDVLGVGQALPFKDDSFDAVFSFAVLEHVTDPFTCADELVRVLKPGGVLFAVVPFLQPFHGYPDHYYNMSSSGLKNLFARRHVVIQECGVPRSGLPIFTLAWFLNSYARGLNPEAAAEFRNLQVKDLMAEPSSYLDLDIVRNLSPAANEELASTNYLVAVKDR